LHVSEDTTTVPKQRRRRKGATDLAAANLSLDLQQTDTSSEPDMAIEKEENKKSESDGLEDYWKDFALAVESTKVRVSTTEFDLYCSNHLKIFNFFQLTASSACEYMYHLFF
jgi:hypothetical protein